MKILIQELCRLYSIHIYPPPPELKRYNALRAMNMQKLLLISFLLSGIRWIKSANTVFKFIVSKKLEVGSCIKKNPVLKYFIFLQKEKNRAMHGIGNVNVNVQIINVNYRFQSITSSGSVSIKSQTCDINDEHQRQVSRIGSRSRQCQTTTTTK